jgi:hypothetical protein
MALSLSAKVSMNMKLVSYKNMDEIGFYYGDTGEHRKYIKSTFK